MFRTYKKQFGGKLTAELIKRYEQSPQWKDGKFQNTEKTEMNIGLGAMPKLLYKQFFDIKGRFPKHPLPLKPFDKDDFLSESDSAKMIWYGHSAVLMRINNKTLLIDPMLGPDAAPIAPFKSRRFSENTLSIIDEFPSIDLLLLTHDHYDHLDLASMEKLIPKTKQFYVALGCGRHLESWDVSSEKIQEFDWWDHSNFNGIDITFTPTRHFSGRGLRDRAKSLWGGWVFKTANENIYFSGDGGYGNHFKEVGEKLGPFDFGLMECGQYNEQWHLIHMYPKEAILAAKDARVKKVMAVHWGGFSLAQHTWQEPIEFFNQSAKEHQLEISNPLIGKVFQSKTNCDKNWWKEHV